MNTTGIKIKKLIPAIAAAAAVLVIAAVVVLIMLLDKGGTGMTVAELNGNVTATDKDGKPYELKEAVTLLEGSGVSTGEASSGRLRVGDSKYIKLGENTLASFEGVDGKSVSVYVSYGTVTSEIAKPLGDGEDYTVITPNAVFSVRGTYFTAEVRYDESGDCYTEVSVFGGSVACSRVMPNGSVIDEETVINAGSSAGLISDPVVTVFDISGGGRVNDIKISDVSDSELLDMFAAASAGHGLFVTADELASEIRRRGIDITGYRSYRTDEVLTLPDVSDGTDNTAAETTTAAPDTVPAQSETDAGGDGSEMTAVNISETSDTPDNTSGTTTTPGITVVTEADTTVPASVTAAQTTAASSAAVTTRAPAVTTAATKAPVTSAAATTTAADDGFTIEAGTTRATSAVTRATSVTTRATSVTTRATSAATRATSATTRVTSVTTRATSAAAQTTSATTVITSKVQDYPDVWNNAGFEYDTTVPADEDDEEHFGGEFSGGTAEDEEEHLPGEAADNAASAQTSSAVRTSVTTARTVAPVTQTTACIHRNTKTVVGREATCTEDGFEYTYCLDCGRQLGESRLAALGHDYEMRVTKQVTCVEDGLLTYVCRHDPSHTFSENISRSDAAHQLVHVDEKPATCTDTGYKGYYICSVCGRMFENGNATGEIITPAAIPAFGHSYTSSVTKQPDCISDGVRTYVCIHDASHTYTESIPMEKDSHDIVYTPAKAPTCTEKGNDAYYVCRTCGKLFSGSSYAVQIERIPEIPALGHDYDEGTVVTEPGCTSKGQMRYTCRHDSSHILLQDIPAKGHDFEAPEYDWREYDGGFSCYVTLTCRTDEHHTETAGCTVTGVLNSDNTVTYSARPQFVEFADHNSVIGTNTVENTDPGLIGATADNFPDESFRRFVSESFDVNHDNLLTSAEKAAVTVIDVTGREDITSLEGIAQFPQLGWLYCGGSGITELDVSENTGLTALDCSDTAIAYLDITANKALTALDCSGCGLAYLDIPGDITVSDLNTEGNVHTVTVTANKLDLTEIEGFDADRMTLGEDNAGGELHGTVLRFNSQEVTYDYECAGGLALAFTLRAENFDPALRPGIALDEENFPDEAFRELAAELFDTDEDGYLGEEEISAAKTLDVSRSGLRSIKGVEFLTALESLDISGNPGITRVVLDANTALKELNCGGTSLDSLSLTANTALEVLDCDNTPMTSLALGTGDSLKELYCTGTKLTALDVSGCAALERLDCSGSAELRRLECAGLTALSALDCSGCALAYVDLSAVALKRPASFLLDYNSYLIPVGETFDLGAIPGFDPGRIRDLTGAELSEDGRTLTGITGDVTYTYVCRPEDDYTVTDEITGSFTLVQSEDAVLLLSTVGFAGSNGTDDGVELAASDNPLLDRLPAKVTTMETPPQVYIGQAAFYMLVIGGIVAFRVLREKRRKKCAGSGESDSADTDEDDE